MDKESPARFNTSVGNIVQRMAATSKSSNNEVEPFITNHGDGAPNSVNTNSDANDLTMRLSGISSHHHNHNESKAKQHSIISMRDSTISEKTKIDDKNNDNNSNTSKYETNASLYIRYFFLFSILLQNSSYTLLRRYNKGVLQDGSSNASMLIGGEFMKIGVSLFMGIRAYLSNTSLSSSLSPSNINMNININANELNSGCRGIISRLCSYFHMLASTSPKLMFPAFVYLCMNWLSLLSLERIDASTFTVIAQCKTLSTALAGYFFLNKRFSQARIRALIHLVCSVIVITYVANNSVKTQNTIETNGTDNDNTINSINNNNKNSEDKINEANASAKFMMGVLFVLIEVSLSGCVSVYYEKVLKDDKNRLTVWDRNIQLATFSIIMYFYSFANDGYFNHWSSITFFVSFLGALGGVLVAFSIKYTDSVLKAMSTSCAIVLTSILSALWLDGPYNIPIAVSSISVVVAIFTYVTDGKMCAK